MKREDTFTIVMPLANAVEAKALAAAFWEDYGDDKSFFLNATDKLGAKYIVWYSSGTLKHIQQLQEHVASGDKLYAKTTEVLTKDWPTLVKPTLAKARTLPAKIQIKVGGTLETVLADLGLTLEGAEKEVVKETPVMGK